MGKGVKPDHWVKSAAELTVPVLRKMGITAVCCDIDNTIALHDGMEIPENILAWICSLREAKIRVVLVSNNGEDRVRPVADRLGVDFAAKAGKPSGKKLRTLLGGSAEHALMVGDQLFTDIWCGNRCKCKTVLTDPMGDDPLLQIRLKRKAERLIMRKWDRKKMSL